MKTCIVCKKALSNHNQYDFHVLEVQTLHLREMSGERKIQALGRFQDFSVCPECASSRLKQDRDYLRGVRKKCIRFGAVLVAGIVLTVCSVLYLNMELVFFLLGLAAIACGLIGIIASLLDGKKRSDQLHQMREEDALRDCAWEAMLGSAPSKTEDADLTYIPVDGTTMNRKNGDLMILYDLVPELAVKAYDMIHREYNQMHSRQI